MPISEVAYCFIPANILILISTEARAVVEFRRVFWCRQYGHFPTNIVGFGAHIVLPTFESNPVPLVELALLNGIIIIIRCL